MRRCAREVGQDVEAWGLAGLLHDVDFEQTRDAPDRHGAVGCDLLAQAGLAPDVVDAIRHHNAEGLGLKRATPFHHALAAAETITGLIVATALVQPDRKLASVQPASVLKRMKKKDFARAVNREVIAECERFGVPLDRFVALAVEAMQGIAEALGL
jgi:putative nucleotidyltransferase with HDIG domain